VDFSDADPFALASAAGADAGSSAGESLALADGAQLGALHGAALGAELGFAEGFGLASMALFPIAAPRAGSVDDASTSRPERTASALVGVVRALDLSRGAPLGADVDVVATVQRVRSLGKQLASSLGLAPSFLDAAVGSGAPRRVGGAADLDF
jgi:hypothetical protein